MELKLDIYKTKLCRKGDVERVATANDFELSTGICEDVLNIINIDMFDGGISSLSQESAVSLIAGIVKDGFPFFMQLVQEIFDLSEDEARRIKISDTVSVVIEIVKYSVGQLASSLGGNKGKN